MRAHRRKRSPMQCRNQSGAAALITVLFLLIVMGFAVLVSLTMSGSDVSDSASQHNSVQALFLAESAIERASGRNAAGTACASLAPDSATIAAGSFTVVSATLVGANCQIRVTGTAAGNTRTVDAVLRPGGGAITVTAPQTNFGAGSSRTRSYTVPAGASILLVGLSINNAATTVNVTYGGTTMTLAASEAVPNPWPKAAIYYLTNPPAGTANVVASFSLNVEAVLGVMSFSGVDTTTPLDVAAVTARGNGTVANPPSITPVTAGAWVFEVVAIMNNDTTTMTPQTNRISRWLVNSNGNVRGGASTIGPISPVAAQNPRWTWTGNNNRWTHASVALRPGGSPSLLSWTEVVQ